MLFGLSLPSLLAKKVPTAYNFSTLSLVKFMSGSVSPVHDSDKGSVFGCKTARRLIFQDNGDGSTMVDPGHEEQLVNNATSSDLVVTKAKKRGRAKQTVPVVDLTIRRSTRQAVRANGFRLEPMRDKPEPISRKKSRASKPMEEEGSVSPHTHVPVLQHVGRYLEIPEEEISVDRLEAHPKQDKPSEKN